MRQDNDALVLRLLDVIERDASTTQRDVASQLGIAVGLANALVRRCVRKGLVKVWEAPARRYAYYVTPKGFAEKSRLAGTFICDSLAFFRRVRAESSLLLNQIVESGHRNALLLGAGDLADVVHLVSHEHGLTILRAPEIDGPIEAWLARLPEADCYIVTSLTEAREVYRCAVERFGGKRVYDLPLLGVSIGSHKGFSRWHPPS